MPPVAIPVGAHKHPTLNKICAVSDLDGFPPFKTIRVGPHPTSLKLMQTATTPKTSSETKTASGIVIPDSAAEKPDQGEVLAVGPGKKNDKGELGAMAVKVGDRVLFGKYSGQTVKVDGDELLVMKEDDLFAVVDAK